MLLAFIDLRFNFYTRLAMCSKPTFAVSILSVGFIMVEADGFIVNIPFIWGGSRELPFGIVNMGDILFLGVPSSFMVNSFARLRFLLSINLYLS